MRLSVIIPVFNEERTIANVIKRIQDTAIDDSELIVVDDGSTDRTPEILENCLDTKTTLVTKKHNEGKTAAVRDGLSHANGQWVIIQDADLEYSPTEIPILLAASDYTQRQAIYGHRPSHWNKPSRWPFVFGVLAVDIAIFIVYRQWIRDHATCYKLVQRQELESLSLESKGFEGCVEITAKLIRSGVRIVQIPIQYTPRTSADGKKLTASYGLVALRTVWKFRDWHPA